LTPGTQEEYEKQVVGVGDSPSGGLKTSFTVTR
jgi:hypothetical protein